MRHNVDARFWFVPAAALALAFGSAVHAASAATTVMPDGSIRYDYGRRPQPLLVCKPQFVCDIALDSNESVLNMAIGDAAHWVIAGGHSGPGGATPHVFVKPEQANLETNLVITTTKRVYNVALKSASDAPHPMIMFAYADDEAALRAAAAEHERQAIDAILAGTPLVAADKADAKYKMTGDTSILPERVFNDGVRTYISWKTLPAELPSVWSAPAGATAQPVNFRVVGTTYVVDAVNPSYDLVIAADTDRHGRGERRVLIRHQ